MVSIRAHDNRKLCSIALTWQPLHMWRNLWITRTPSRSPQYALLWNPAKWAIKYRLGDHKVYAWMFARRFNIIPLNEVTHIANLTNGVIPQWSHAVSAPASWLQGVPPIHSDQVQTSKCFCAWNNQLVYTTVSYCLDEEIWYLWGSWQDMLFNQKRRRCVAVLNCYWAASAGLDAPWIVWYYINYSFTAQLSLQCWVTKELMYSSLFECVLGSICVSRRNDIDRPLLNLYLK